MSRPIVNTRYVGTTKPPVKRRAIVTELKAQVLNGDLPPGAMLPSQSRLQSEYDASPSTIQEAMDLLREEGFIESRPGVGSFVSARPPHLYRFPVIFQQSRPTPQHPWPGFLEALHLVTETDRGVYDLPAFCGVSDHVDVPEYQQLILDVEARCLAGLIFSSFPGRLLTTPLLANAKLPRVAIMEADPHTNLPAVYPDFCSFVDRALDYLHARGRRRVAVIAPWWNGTRQTKHFRDQIAARGWPAQEAWWLHADPFNFQGQTNLTGISGLVRLLFQPERTQRPDALIVGDDNLVPGAVAGLAAAGVTAPRDVEVVAHWNFPLPVPTAPFHYLGFDVGQLLRTCVKILEQQRGGETPAAMTRVTAVTEQERQL